MSIGLLAVVDDILTISLKASSKAVGVVVDDVAVTPQYVQGLSPAREMPVVWRIARGSLANKFLVIIPVALLLTAFAPWVLPWLLIIGGSYLCFEGAEKVLEWFGFHSHDEAVAERDENRLVAGAIRTDLVLSAEIMLISLAALPTDLGFWMTLASLSTIAVIMTGVVYGVVALLVKLDDMGLKMAKSPVRRVRHTGTRIVRSMPAIFRVISIVGTIAMLWVGGHLVVVNLAEVGWSLPLDIVHAVEHALEPLGGVIVWIGATAMSAIAGFIVGIIIVGIVLGVAKLFGKKPSFTEGGEMPSSVH